MVGCIAKASKNYRLKVCSVIVADHTSAQVEGGLSYA